MQSRFSESGRREASTIIAAAIGATLAVWWIPFVSGLACNVAEGAMVGRILRALDRNASAREEDALFWFFRKKYMFVWGFTYIPWVGPAMQIVEVYALGQFVLVSAESLLPLDDEVAMEAAWRAVEPQIWSGTRVVDFYEEFAGLPFPTDIREPFIRAVESAALAVRAINRIPGSEAIQGAAGEGLRGLVRGARSLLGD